MRLSIRRYSSTAHNAPPVMLTAWRLERQLRKRRLWISTEINRPRVGDVLVRTECGTLRVVPSGAVRRVGVR